MGHVPPLDGDAARGILQSLPLAVTVIDPDGRLRFVNDAAAKLFGAAVDDLLGGSAVELTVGAADTTAIVELMANVAAGHPWLGRFPLTGPDGRRIDAWFASTRIDGDIVSVGGEAAELERALGSDDVATLAERSREDAEEANRLLTTVLDAVPVAMAFFDRDARFVRVNRALAAINGATPRDYVGGTISDIARIDDAAFRRWVEGVFATGEVVRDRVVSAAPVSAPDDVRHWIVTLFPVMLRGAIAWVGATAVDVTEWRRNEDERTRLLEAEKFARRAAEEAAQRLARLQVVTARLAEATTIERVAETVVANGAAGLGATGAGLLVVSPTDDRELVTVASAGFAEEAVRRFARVDIDSDTPAGEAARTRELILVRDREEWQTRWPSLADVPRHSHSAAVLPLVLDGALKGVITLGWSVQREFSQADRDFLMALGRQCVLALERVRLYEAERTARAVAEEATERMAFLAEASRVLGASLDYNETLVRLAQLAVREIADVCTIHLAQNDEFRIVGAAHRDPRKLDALVAAATAVASSPRLLGRVVATGTPTVIPEMAEVIDEIAHSAEHAQRIEEVGLGSVISVPLVLSGRPLGVLSLGWSVGDRRYTEADLPFVQDIAARVAGALENSLVHEARTEVARTLQQSLLPPVEPRIPGLEVATRYHSAGEVDVGGDFFDVFPSGDGRWGVVMGDVCGRGVAAASLTALARYTVRAGAIDEGDPSQVLHLLNRAILDTDTGERFCTITHSVVEPTANGANVTLACGGHPLPLLLRADGTVEEVGVPGSAIGLFEELDISEVDLELRRGDALVLFTDGFTEARAPDGRFAPDLLEAALGGAAGGTAEQLAEAIDRAVLAFEGGRPRDDMALLILRVPAVAAPPR